MRQAFSLQRMILFVISIALITILCPAIYSENLDLNKVMSYYSSDNIYGVPVIVNDSNWYNNNHTFVLLNKEVIPVTIDISGFDLNLSSNKDIYMIVSSTSNNLVYSNIEYSSILPTTFSKADLSSPKGYVINNPGSTITFNIRSDTNKVSIILYQKTKDYLNISYFDVLNLTRTEIYKYELFQLNKEIVKYYCSTCYVKDLGINKEVSDILNPIITNKSVTMQTTGNKNTCFDPTNKQEGFGITGQDNYERYGFDNLYFSWLRKDITYNTFDYGTYFVDPDQLKMSLTLKADLLSDFSNYITLDGIDFKKDDYTRTIEDSFAYLNLDLKQDLYLVNESNNLTDSLTNIEKVVNLIPESITRQTIMDIYVDGNTSGMDEFFAKAILDTNTYSNYNNYVNKTEVNNNYSKITVYELPLSVFLNKYSEIQIYTLASFFDENKEDVLLNILSGFNGEYNYNYFYLGTSLNKSIINIKPFGDLKSGISKEILETSGFLTNEWKFAIDVNGITNITSPQTFIIELDNINQNNKTGTLRFIYEPAINRYLNNYQANLYYQKNPLFTTLINASYFDYSKIPFVKESDGHTQSNVISNNYTDYSNIGRIQEGYLFKLDKDGNSIKYSYADVRPILITSSTEVNTQINYLIDSDYITYDNNISSKEDIIFAFTNFIPKDPVYDYQAIISSKTPLTFSLNNYSMINDTKDNEFIYGINNNLSDDRTFFSINAEEISSIINGIKQNRICFASGPNSLRLWINPLVISGQEVDDTEYYPDDGMIGLPDHGPSPGGYQTSTKVSTTEDVLFEVKDMPSLEKYHMIYMDMYYRMKYNLEIPEQFKNKIDLVLDKNEMISTLTLLDNYENAFKDKNDFYEYQKQVLGYDTIVNPKDSNKGYIDNRAVSLRFNTTDVIFGPDYKYELTLGSDTIKELLKYNQTHIVSDKNTLSFIKQFWNNPSIKECSGFSVAFSQFLFKYKYTSNDAGCLKQTNQAVWCYSKSGCVQPSDAKRGYLTRSDLDKVIPGSLLGVYLPKSNLKQDCGKVNYTHVGVYLGKINGNHLMVENWAGKYRIISVDVVHMSSGREVREVIMSSTYLNFLDEYYNYLIENKISLVDQDKIIKMEQEKLKEQQKRLVEIKSRLYQKENPGLWNKTKGYVNEFGDWLINLFN